MLDPARLLALKFPEIVHSYATRDTILYALGVGVGADPLSPAHLRHVYEEGLVALPTMAVTLAYPGFWYRDLDTGLDFARIVHGAEAIVLHAPLPVAGTVVATPSVVDVIDKGARRGALVISERTIRDRDGQALATVRQTAFCRGDGGFGGEPRSLPRPPEPPARPADRSVHIATLPQAALIYRLSGDPNPLHVDPAAAREAGFERPILHGLCTMGMIGHAALGALFGGDAAALGAMDCRFSAPVVPGATLHCEFWSAPGGWQFRARAGGREVASGSLGTRDAAA
jgi:acyl dehydratase